MTLSLRSGLEYGVRIAFIVAALAFAYSIWGRAQSGKSQADTVDLVELSEPVKVSPRDLHSPLENGGVRILEFADFECPFCVRHAKETLPSLRAQFIDRGLISYEFRHFPLETIHAQAVPAARAAECARLQNQFWRFHDGLLNSGTALAPAEIQRVGESSVPDPRAFRQCVEGRKTDVAVEADKRLANQLGIRSTPTFVVLRGTATGAFAVATIGGAYPLETFRKAIRIATNPPALAK